MDLNNELEKIKGKINEIQDSFKNIWPLETIKKFKLIFLVWPIIFLILISFIFWWNNNKLSQWRCDQLNEVIESYKMLPDEYKTNEVKNQVEETQRMVNEKC